SAVDDCRRAKDRPAWNFELPKLFAFVREAVERFITRAKENGTIRKVGASGNLGVGLERPPFGAGGRIDTVKDSIGIANEYGAVSHTRRRLEGRRFVFPFLCSRCQIESVQMLVEGTDVNRAVYDRRRPFNPFLCLDLPADFELFGKCGDSTTGLERIAAE